MAKVGSLSLKACRLYLYASQSAVRMISNAMQSPRFQAIGGLKAWPTKVRGAAVAIAAMWARRMKNL